MTHATYAADINPSADTIDVRHIIARVEELETDLADAHDDADQNDVLDMRAERDMLRALLAELSGNGGDEQWEGDWYPTILIRDSYFREYAQELAEDIGAIPDNASWPCTCIDWDKAAWELRMDYTSAEFEGVTYWYR